MSVPMAAWRLSYTSGNWLAMAGPTSLVIMMAPPASVSPLVEELWVGTLETRSPDALFKFIAEAGISTMPHFGAFFWDAKGLHGLSRGDIQVVDADSGDVMIDGSGTVTWSEDQLDAERTYTIQLEEVEEDVATLPLVVGTALVSSLTLTTAREQVLRFPSMEQTGVLGKIPVLGLRPRSRKPIAQRAAGAPLPAAESVAEPTSEPRSPATPEPEVPAASAPEPTAAPEPEVAQQDAPQQESAPDPDHSTLTMPAVSDDADADTEDDLHTVPFDPSTLEEVPSAASPHTAVDPPHADEAHRPPVPPIPAPAAPPTPAAPPPVAPQGGRSAPVVVPGTFGEVDDDDPGTIFSTGIAATHKPAAPDAGPDPQVLAVPCAQGHPNPAGARGCRLCQAPVDSSNPRLVRRPVLAGVNTNQGEFADILTAVVVGRSPDASHGPQGSYLMRVPSPGNDISRSHLRVSTKDWNIVVTDLHSTNGTTVKPPGEPEFELRDGRSVTVEIGTILDLGDGVALRIEPPRSS